MTTARRLGRGALYAVAAAAALLVLLWIGVHIYLAMPAGRALVARLIEERIGMPVEVQSVWLGVRSSSIGFSIYDPKVGHDVGEVFGVKSATANVSIFDLLRGRIDPTEVDLRGAVVHLRLDAHGNLLTTLPQSSAGTTTMALPVIAVQGGSLTIQQEGRPEFAVRNANLRADPQADGQVALSGTVDDPSWDHWTLSGSLNRATSSGSVTLATDNGPLTLELLRTVPYLPASIWQHVHPAGRGAISVVLTETPAHETDYRIDIRPANATMTITDANTELRQVTGLFRIAGDRLDLQGVHAELAGGTISMDGDADLTAKATVVQVKASASGLDIQRLPAEWGLPRDITGKLKGNADLSLTVRADGVIEPRGGGSGVIENAAIRGIPAAITLRLVGTGKQYRFENHNPNPPAPKTGTSRSHGDAHKPVPCAGQAPAAQPKQSAPALDATIKLRDVELSELLDKLNLKLNYAIGGKVSATVQVRIPFGQSNAKVPEPAISFHGVVTAPALRFEQLVIRDVTATAIYEGGKLTLSELKGAIDAPAGSPSSPRGTFRATAVVQQSPPGAATASFTFDDMPMGEILKAVPGWSIEVLGPASGKADFTAPFKDIGNPKTWSASADLHAPELLVAKRRVQDLHAGVIVRDGTATLSKAGVTVEGIPIVAEAKVTLAGKYPFTAAIKTTSTQAADLRKLVPGVEVPAVEGLLAMNVQASGTASPLDFHANGRITASQLVLDQNPANNVEIVWQLTQERLVVSELKASLFNGSISGKADIPFAADRGGKFDLAFKNVNAAGATAFVPDFPLQIGGNVSGTVNGTIVPAKPGQSRIGKLDVEMTARRLTVQGIPSERLAGTAIIERGILNYHLHGKALGGTFEVRGAYPGAPPKGSEPVQKSQRGSFTLKGIELARIGPDLGIPTLNPLRGRIDATFSFENDLSAGSGRVTVSGMSWGNTLLARELTGVLLLDHGVARLAELSGRFAGGELRARAELHLKDINRSSFTIILASAQAQKLLAVVPDSGFAIDAPVTVSLHGNLGRELRGRGLLTITNGTVSGVPVADVKVPFDWYIGANGFSRLAIRDATANAGTGKVEAHLTLETNAISNVDGYVKFTNVPLRTIVPELGSYSVVGNGRITGKFTVIGHNVRSLDDLDGTLVGILSQASIKEIPILQRIVPFINPTALMQPFQRGDIQGVLRRGVFTVERLALVNPGGQIFARGTITLAGRIEAIVVAHMGALGPADRGLALLAGRLPLVGPVPFVLIRDVTSVIANRSIRISVSGPVAHPSIQANATDLLTETAVRFFLASYALP